MSSSSPLTAFMALLLTLLSLSLCASVVSTTPLPSIAQTSTGVGSGNWTVSAGAVSVETNFSFPIKGDGIGCLSSDATASIAFAGSNAGSIFSWPLKARPATVSPVYTVGTGTTAGFWACQANPAGTLLYLLDTRGVKLWSFNLSTPTTAPVVVGSFPDEQVGTLVALAIDFNNSIAYVGTRYTDFIYAVNISAASIYASYQMQTDITALALSADARTLYYGIPAILGREQSGINSLDVKAGVIPNPGSPTVIYTSTPIIYPTSIITSNSSLLFFTDGGPLGGHDRIPTQLDPQAIYALSTQASPAGSLTTLLSTTMMNLPSGLVLSNNRSELYFTTTSTVNSLSLAAEMSGSSSTSVGPPPAMQSTASMTSAEGSTHMPSPPIGGTASVGMSQSSAPSCAVGGGMALMLTAASIALLW